MIVCPLKIIVLIFYTYMHLRGEVKDESDIKDPTDDEEPGLTSLIWPQNLKLQEKNYCLQCHWVVSLCHGKMWL